MRTILLLLSLLVQTPVAARYSVSGHVERFPDASELSSTVILKTFGFGQTPAGSRTAALHADGTFEFPDVPAGEHDINLYDARQPFQQVGQTSQGSTITQFTAIGPGLNFTFKNQNVTGLEIKMPAGLNGRIVMANGGTVPPVVISATTPLSFNSSFSSGRSMRARTAPTANGQFTLGVFPGENTITVASVGNNPDSGSITGGYSVKSITYGGNDLMNGVLVLARMPNSALLITLDR